MLRRSSASSTTPELDASGTRALLDRLQSRLKDFGEEHRQILQDIYRMADEALTQAESELEGHSMAQDDGVLVQTFIPLMTRTLGQTVQYVENHWILVLGAQIPRRRTSLFRIGSHRTNESTKELMILRNNLAGIYFIAMAPAPSLTSSVRADVALDIAARIGSTLAILADSFPALGPLNLVGTALSEVCSTVQTLRSNQKLAAEIMHGIRDYFRMVVRKVQKYPGAQADEELRRDVEELLKILLSVQKTLLEMKRKKGRVGSSVLFAQKDQDSLNALSKQVQESRSMFEASLHLSTHLTVSQVAIGMFELSTGVNSIIARLESFDSSTHLELVRQQSGTSAVSSETPPSTSNALLALPPPNTQVGTDQGFAALMPPAEPRGVQLNRSKEQWVSVRIDPDTASHIKRHSAVSLLPYMGVYFFF